MAVWWRNEHPDGQSPQLWEVAEKRGNSQDLELDSAHYSHSKPKYTECFFSMVLVLLNSTKQSKRQHPANQVFPPIQAQSTRYLEGTLHKICCLVREASPPPENVILKIKLAFTFPPIPPPF